MAAKLQGRVVFVTGGGSGIGRAGAIAMAAEGAHVVVTDRNRSTADEVVKEICAAGGSGEADVLDVTDDVAIDALFSRIIEKHGRLDVLHSHAGLQVEGSLEQITVEQLDKSWDLNVRSHFITARAVVKQMRRQGGGSIIITASNSATQIDAGMLAYTTTKHAAVAMVKQMAKDLAGDNIRVNALCPGFIDTPFNAGFERQMGGRNHLEDYIAEAIPMGRFGLAEEIADSILFLASDSSRYMTGVAFVVDGGENL